MKKLIFLLFAISFLQAFSQKKYAKEFSFINDNDLYISTTQDRYYTNGMFFSYRYLANNSNERVAKKMYQFQLGHHMYTPFKATVDLKGEHDRPFAGYLYGSFGVDYFFKNNDVLKISAQIGVIGPNALGWEMQDIVHDIYGFKKAIGWKYQITNAFALNIDATYVKPIYNTNYVDVHWYNNVKLGTVFTDATTGLYARVGFIPLQKLVNSIAFGGNLNNNKTSFNNEVEVFFYAKPTISFVGYDATIQGSFLNDNSPVTYGIKHFQYAGEFGIRFTANRFNFGYAVHFHSKKLESVRVPNTNFYGSIQLNYQFN